MYLSWSPNLAIFFSGITYLSLIDTVVFKYGGDCSSSSGIGVWTGVDVTVSIAVLSSTACSPCDCRFDGVRVFFAFDLSSPWFGIVVVAVTPIEKSRLNLGYRSQIVLAGI